MQVNKSSFQAIGTKWDITVAEAIDDTAWQGLLEQIHARIDEFDHDYSRFRADSLVTQMSKKAGIYDLPADGFKLLQWYEQLYEMTDGKITPLIGQTMADAGYDADYSFKPKPLKSPPRWEDILTYDAHHLEIRQPVLLDFGAAGKGYVVDIVGELLQAAGVRTYTINAGGDILQRSADGTSLEVGLENPLDASEAIGILQLNNRSLCASAGSKRSWGEFHHVIDPVELRSPTDVLATWVLAADTMTADGLASALFFTSPARLQSHVSFGYAVLGSDMNLSHSVDFPAEIFEAQHE